MSPGSASYFSHYNGEVKQLITHKGLPTSFCSFIKPLL